MTATKKGASPAPTSTTPTERLMAWLDPKHPQHESVVEDIYDDARDIGENDPRGYSVVATELLTQRALAYDASQSARIAALEGALHRQDLHIAALKELVERAKFLFTGTANAHPGSEADRYRKDADSLLSGGA